MGRTSRKKKHTHVAPADGSGAGQGGVAKTFVMERGKVGRLLSQLVLDLRRVMEPHTASKLKVRQKNVLKDFLQVAGPLGVTHFIVVSRTDQFVNLKVCRLPRGPTLTFHVNAFCLSREVISRQKNPLSTQHQFLSPPMLIMNNFPPEDGPSKLMSTVFQNMFPSINVQTVKLSNIKRCLLLFNNPQSNTVELRHYAIRVQPRGMSKGVKTLAGSHVPDLSSYKDISEYVLGGQGSDSEGEELGVEGEVILPQDLPGRGNTHSQQSAIKLSELGPRLTLQLVKVEAGLCEGEVLHHAFIQKSKKEQKILKTRIEGAKKLRAERRHQQEANVARKQSEKDLHRQQCMDGMAETVNSEGGDSGEEESDDDVEWYRKEVGEEPDPDTFTSSGGRDKVRLVGLKRHRKVRFSSSASGGGSKRRRTGAESRSSYDKRRDSSGRSEHNARDKRHSQKKPVVRFAEKRKRTVKGKQITGRGAVKRRPGGQAFRRRAKGPG